MIPVNLRSVALTVQISGNGMTNRKETGPEPEFDSSMAFAVWLIISLVVWGVLLLLLLI